MENNNNQSELEFTGERFMPDLINDDVMVAEHMQRYLSIAPLIKGKKIIDIACGEGYGSEILARSAASVTGMDISVEAVEHAAAKYRRDNLSFRVGSISDIPEENSSLDAIVSFETIEHVPEELQWDFIREAKRVLKDEGFLVISTPNKKEYSDSFQYHN